MLHTTGMYPAQLSCTRLSVALAYHPEYKDSPKYEWDEEEQMKSYLT